MWIRSQDRLELIEVKRIRLTKSISDNNGSVVYMKDGYMVVGDGVRLATYKTELRALEVLNEIEYSIETIEIMKLGVSNRRGTGFIYAMPVE